MTEVLRLALSFPGVVYTVLLGVVLVYWLFVVVGAIHLGDGSADGHFDGIGDHGADVGDLGQHGGDIADGGDGSDVGEGDVSEGSAVAALIHALHLRSVPATVIFSLIITFSWLVCTIAMQLVSRAMPAGSQVLLGWLVLAGSPILALPLTSISARPLAKVFVQRRATSHSDLIGKTCVVRTGTVTPTFGEASLEDGGAGLVLRVRVDRELPVKRGDQMLIVEWDRERESFLVEPLDSLELREEHARTRAPDSRS
ncbi:MAG TPA: glycine zipper family protein [Polyangiaceae bacterium]|nr:glycine zipper family protein [Polyangiaceae bacterium]